MLSKILTGQELAGELIHTRSTKLQINKEYVVPAMRDGASVNGAAMKIFKVVYPHLLDVTCLSHTIDIWLEITSRCLLWIQLSCGRLNFLPSCAAKLRWKERVGFTMKSCSATRWWSEWEVMEKLIRYFGDVELFLEQNQDVAPSITDHLRVLLAEKTTYHGVRCG